jgi:hypothetical protein
MYFRETLEQEEKLAALWRERGRATYVVTFIWPDGSTRTFQCCSRERAIDRARDFARKRKLSPNNRATVHNYITGKVVYGKRRTRAS